MFSSLSSLGLIGYPIAHSKSDRYHNYFLSHLGLSDRYRKFEVLPQQLNDFLAFAKQQNRIGLSVTMPHKQSIIPLLDEVEESAQKIGAVNTVKFIQGKAFGYNTDGNGALQAIHSVSPNLVGKRAIILGAGGVARSIAWVLLKVGMEVTISNRTFSRAQDLAQTIGATCCLWEELDPLITTQCDLLVNATSVGMVDEEMIFPPSQIPSQVMVFDVVSFPRNQWLETLQKKGCPIISGKLFWIFQAIEQYKIWFDQKLNLSSAFSILTGALTLSCNS